MDTTKLTEDQRIAYNGIVDIIKNKREMILKSYDITDRFISLSGAAGTGKTYLTTNIVEYLAKNNIPLTITAPTHKAVSVISKMLTKNKINASCKTIHSFLGIKLFQDFDAGKEVFTIDKTNKKQNATSVLIVDESSMISFELFEYILDAVESSRVDIVLFVGDPYQLLPIGNSRNDIFNLQNHFTLNEVVRQAKDSYIIKIATKIRKMIETQNFISPVEFFRENHEKESEYFYNMKDFIKDFHKDDNWYDKNQVLGSHKNQDVSAFNNILRTKYWSQKEINNPPMLLKDDNLIFKDSYSRLDKLLYQNGQDICIEKAKLCFDHDLQINYWHCKAVNHPEQEVIKIVDTNSALNFNNQLKRLTYKAKSAKFPKRNEYWKDFFDIKNDFADVQYIYSSTIHKLQGSTYDTVYIDIFSLLDNPYMSDDEKYRLIYVAITRASKNIKLFLPANTKQETTLDISLIEHETNVLSISKNKLENDFISIGAISKDGEYLQLLYKEGKYDININDNVIIKYYRNKNQVLPHSEDVDIHYSKKISTNNQPLISIVKKMNIMVYEASPTLLFSNKLLWENEYWNNVGYVSTFDISNTSVCFWITDKDLHINNGKYEYIENKNTYTFDYIGKHLPTNIIPKGTLLQMVLSRPNGLIEKFNEEKFYLQIGEYFVLDNQANIINKIQNAIDSNKKIHINYFKDGANVMYENVIPYKLFHMNNSYYIAAEFDDIYKFKLLRVDKIRYIESLELISIQNRNIKEFIDYIQTPFPKYSENFKENLIQVKVEVSAEKVYFFEIKKHLATQQIIKRKENGNVIISFLVTQELEVEELIKKWLPYMKVIEPISLDEKIKNDIKAYLI